MLEVYYKRLRQVEVKGLHYIALSHGDDVFIDRCKRVREVVNRVKQKIITYREQKDE